MRMYIPEIGTKLCLARDWSFKLYCEGRTLRFYKAITNDTGLLWWYGPVDRRPPVVDVTLPAGTKLIVDRIYIRKGKSGWSSITVRIDTHPTNSKLNKSRFWVKLPDFNAMEVEDRP